MSKDTQVAELLPPEQLVRAWLYVDTLEKEARLDRVEATSWRDAILRRLRECGLEAVLRSV